MKAHDDTPTMLTVDPERRRQAYEYLAYQAAQLAWDLGIDAVTADIFDPWIRQATDHEIATSFEFVRHLTGRSRNHWREEDCRLQLLVLAVVKFGNGDRWTPERERLAHLVSDTKPRRWRVRYSAGASSAEARHVGTNLKEKR